jgi:hypothetical protein
MNDRNAPPRAPINWTAVTYNASIAAGVSLISVGAGCRWGWAIGAISAGVLINALTLFATLISRRQARP